MINPYEKNTTIAFWTDPWISKNMLKVHLDPKNDLASRRPKIIKKTVDFIDGFMKEKQVICDFGCGPGLYTDMLSKKGYDVIGVDVSETSLEYARNTNPTVNYLKMDYVMELVPRKIDFGMMIYCDFGALDPVSQSSFLKNLKYVLNEDGLFLFDVMSHTWFEKQKESYQTYSETGGFYCEDTVDVVEKTILYPKLKLVLRDIDIKGDAFHSFINRDKCYDVKEMEILLRDNGFEIVEVYSNTYGGKVTNKSDNLAFLIKKK